MLYIYILALLAAASQRFEFELLEWVGDTFGIEYLRIMLDDWQRKERGALPGVTESLIIVYILGKRRTQHPFSCTSRGAVGKLCA